MIPAKKAKIGAKGEQVAMSFIRQSIKGCRIMQLDWIVIYKGSVIIFEIKTQEKYNNPNGHGLPPYQIKSRLELAKLFRKQARFILIVLCLTDVCIYTLEVGEDWESLGFYTKTKKRFIFRISEFKKHDVFKSDIEDILQL